MKSNPNKVKLFLFLAIVLALGLLILNIALVVSIHTKNKLIEEQNSTIAKQEQVLQYYNQKK